MALLTGLADYHIHTELCGHAQGKLEDYVKAARDIGLVEMGFSDHFPLLEGDRTGLAMSLEELPIYYESVARLRETQEDIRVKVGIEVDYIPGQEKRIEEILRDFEFDYVLGSIHHIGELDFANSKNLHILDSMDFDTLYGQYFTLLTECAQAGLFDILAHPDVIKKYGHSPSFDKRCYFEKAAQAVADAGICIEVNTSGLRKPGKEIFPSAEFLKICHEASIPIILGSDAHKPRHVGAGFAEALELGAECGYTEVTLFSKREVVAGLGFPVVIS